MQEAVAEGAGQYMESILQPVLVQGLTVLAKEKPCAHPVEALSFLGQWLLDNNPNKVSSIMLQIAGSCTGSIAISSFVFVSKEAGKIWTPQDLWLYQSAGCTACPFLHTNIKLLCARPVKIQT